MGLSDMKPVALYCQPETGIQSDMTSGERQPNEHARDATAAPSVQVQKAFGRKHALTIEAQQTRAEQRTLAFEFAAALEQPGSRAYDWAQKLTIQLKPDHLPLYAAVLLGDLDRLQLDHYGENRNKSLVIEADPNGYVAIKGFTEGRGHAVPILPDRLFWLSVQVVGRICEQSGGAVDAIAAKALIRRTAEMWAIRATKGTQ